MKKTVIPYKYTISWGFSPGKFQGSFKAAIILISTKKHPIMEKGLGRGLFPFKGIDTVRLCFWEL